MRNRIAFLSIVLLAGSAQAKSTPTEINACTYAEFAAPPFQMATLTGDKNEQIWVQAGGYTLHSDDWRASAPKSLGQCPNAKHPSVCNPKGYLSPGAKVLVTRTMKDFACVTAETNHSVLSGWVPAHNVLNADTPADWPGSWLNSVLHNGTPTLAVTRDGTNLHIDAAMTWYKNRNAHLLNKTAITGTGEIVDAHASLIFTAPIEFGAASDKKSCKADAWLAGDYLVMRDNGTCFDGRISMSGVYRRNDKH